MSKPITILQLYPKDMNIYGDHGNLQVLKKRLEWHGYEPIVIAYNVGDTLPENVDIIIGGGGQDSGQEKIHKDLLSIGPQLKTWADNDVPALLVCGLYQLYGKFFKTSDDTILDGIGILDVETHATSERLIGNIVTESKEFGTIIGYENHSGQTYLGDNAASLAVVIKGAGNNSQDGHEGARYRNVIGTYLHGSLLPKNPAVADFLIKTAVEKRYGTFKAKDIDDSLSRFARDIAQSRPR